MVGNMWLASFPKSGNTWTRTFLANYLFGGKDPISINDLDQHCAGDADVRYYEPFLDGDIQGMSPQEVYAVRPQAHQSMVEHTEGSTLVKIHNRRADFAGVPTVSPDMTAGAVYIIRNPFDTAVSYASHIGQSLDLAIQAMASPDLASPPTENLIFQDLGSWTDHAVSWTSSKDIYMILMHYEAMIMNPEKAFENLISFLRVPLDKKKLQRCIEFSSFDSLANQEKEHGFAEIPPVSTSSFFRSGKVGAWRDVLNKDQIEFIGKKHAKALRKFGYMDERGHL